jgi:polysaccharide pyruvyl transferase WcaK-like protein
MKKVLLFADVGGHDHNQYYHVGDEAMMYETYRWYRKNHPDWRINLLSWFPTHKSLKVTEFPHLLWKSPSYTYFPLLLIRFFLYQFFGMSRFSPEELSLVQTIQDQDRIHFSGGGNLSSQFRPWLYYALFIIIVAKFSKKEILLTSQTIGPISGIDLFFSGIILNLPSLIGIRAKTHRFSLLRYGILFPRIVGMLDSAYTLPVSKASPLPSIHAKRLRIGLSIHAWKHWEQKLQNAVIEALTLLAEKYPLTIILIPHHLGASKDSDMTYMKRISKYLPSSVQVYTPPSGHIENPTATSALYIKWLTSQAQILLTTRYHGIIFALSSNVPTISLNFDEYYRQKNDGAFDLILNEIKRLYQIDMRQISLAKWLFTMLVFIVSHYENEKRLLDTRNSCITSSHHTLDSVLRKFENTSKLHS